MVYTSASLLAVYYALVKMGASSGISFYNVLLQYEWQVVNKDMTA
jgi:hypothetical protein